MDTKMLLSFLIVARTSLKTNDPKRALQAVREAIRIIDPDQTIEMEMRGDQQLKKENEL